MYKSLTSEIKQYSLDTALHKLHKDTGEKSDFGMDSTSELIDGGFGLYSTVNTKTSIGPIKSEYYRISLTRAGSADFTIGLEQFRPVKDTIVFGFPGQLFSLRNPSDDFFAYYMLFKEDFIAESLMLKKHRNQFPFLNYSGTQCFPLGDEAAEIESFIMKINDEVKARKSYPGQAIRLYVELIMMTCGRVYAQQILAGKGAADVDASLFTRYLKLVSEHFLTIQKVSAYAEMLHVSADHLNRIVKAHSDKTAHELIDEMRIREAKAYLRHSALSIAEIAYALNFSDPSHFNKFYKKLTGFTPLQYRSKSE